MSSTLDADTIKITAEELLNLRNNCLARIRGGQLHDLRNDAKLRAVNTTQTYEEFKDIVDAAHLRPISKQDKSTVKTKTRLWNTAAREQDNETDS